MFHRSDDLLQPYGADAWATALNAISGSNIRLGVSCYSPFEISMLQDKFGVSVAQLPGNALDQRLRATSLNNIELHLRSVFLQGILLMAPEKAAMKLPHGEHSFNVWRKWCDEYQMLPLQAALSIAKALPGVRYCVVGADKLTQLEEIATAWEDAPPIDGSALAIDNLDIIDPRRWLVN